VGEVGDTQQEGEEVANINENLLTEPTSTPALSLTFNVHVPLGFCPSNKDRGPLVSGEKLPETGVPDTDVIVDTFGKPPSSSIVVKQMFSLVPPR
jgi:hypothetical protein